MDLIIVVPIVVAITLAALVGLAVASGKLEFRGGLRGRRGRTSDSSMLRKKDPLTVREQPMYFALREAAPDAIVLAQVSFNALIACRDPGLRHRLNRKVADFVLCTRAFNVIAIIELDDSSHDEESGRDRTRDNLLINSGHAVIRYRTVPDVARIREDLAKINVETPDTEPKWVA